MLRKSRIPHVYITYIGGSFVTDKKVKAMVRVSAAMMKSMTQSINTPLSETRLFFIQVTVV